MKKKSIALYLIGIFLLLIGNRKVWDELCALKKEKERLRKQAKVNDGIEKRFEIQKLEYDSINKRLNNPALYFQLIALGKPDFKSSSKAITRIEKDDDEYATDSQ